MVLVEAAEESIDGGPPTEETAASPLVDPGPCREGRMPPEVLKKWLLRPREEVSGYAGRLLVDADCCEEEEVDLSWSMARSAAMVDCWCCEWWR